METPILYTDEYGAVYSFMMPYKPGCIGELTIRRHILLIL